MDQLIVTNLLNAIKARLVAANPEGVSIDYTLRKELGSFNGRFVNIYLLRAGKTGPANREEDFFDVVVGIVNGYRYVDRSSPPRAWIEERIEDELKNIYDVLTSPRMDFLTGFWPQSDEFSVICSHEMLEEKKTFWGEFEVTMRTIVIDDLIQTSF